MPAVRRKTQPSPQGRDQKFISGAGFSRSFRTSPSIPFPPCLPFSPFLRREMARQTELTLGHIL